MNRKRHDVARDFPSSKTAVPAVGEALSRYEKLIAANPKVELCYLDEQHNQVRLTGIVQVVTEHDLLKAIWDNNPLLRQYLGSLDNPELIVYRVEPTRVRYMQEWALEYYEVPFEEGRANS